MQSCSKKCSFCFQRIEVLLCQNKGKSEIVWSEKCLRMSSIFGQVSGSRSLDLD